MLKLVVMKNRTVDLAEELTKRLDDDTTSQPVKASDAAVMWQEEDN